MKILHHSDNFPGSSAVCYALTNRILEIELTGQGFVDDHPLGIRRKVRRKISSRSKLNAHCLQVIVVDDPELAIGRTFQRSFSFSPKLVAISFRVGYREVITYCNMFNAGKV